MRGEDVRTGFAEAVDDDFALVVRWPDGTRETVTGAGCSAIWTEYKSSGCIA